jgi:succinoglycan biosynthesis protein ExoW
MITVVIPYFQRQAGILRRALASVAAQRDCPLPRHVVVVDDASPVSAASELEGFELPGATIEVVRQKNGGPGAARNAGLDRIAKGTRYVAFLDSDDEWIPDHLARAVLALESGFDFYFADLYQIDQKVGAFARAGRIQPADHPTIPGATGLHAYRGDMFNQILYGNVIGTPTVVYRLEGFSHLRFRSDLTSAGEDYLFWMSLSRAGARIAFSDQIETTCGRGVNVFAGAGWASDEFLVRVRNEIEFRKIVVRLFDTSADQRQRLNSGIKELRRSFAASVLHRIRHRQQLSSPLLAAHWRTDPMSFASIPSSAVRGLLRLQ